MRRRIARFAGLVLIFALPLGQAGAEDRVRGNAVGTALADPAGAVSFARELVADHGYEAEFTAADDLLFRLAERNRRARLQVGDFFLNRGDYVAAYRYFKMLSRSGEVLGLKRLSSVYLDGRIVPRNIDRAAELQIEAVLSPGGRGLYLIDKDGYPPAFVAALKRLAIQNGLVIREGKIEFSKNSIRLTPAPPNALLIRPPATE